MMDTGVAAHVDANLPGYLEDLRRLLEFRSISAVPAYAADVRACAEWLAGHLAGVGFDSAELLETGGHPTVHARLAGAGPTVIVYGHYDVQPVEPVAAWTSPPFEPAVRGESLFARGASDNKGQFYANVCALRTLLDRDGEPPCTVHLVIEGEEEWRSEGFRAVLERHAGALRADLVIISDITLAGRGRPSLTLGLRGFAALQLTVRTAATDLHSGLFGGVEPNAAHVLAGLVAGLHDASGRTAVEGFYDDVRAPSAAELESWAELDGDGAAQLDAVGVRGRAGEPGYGFHERIWSRPSLDVNGLWSGFTSDGLKTIIPAEAHAKLSCRLVPGQDPGRVLGLLRAQLARQAPPGVTVSVDWDLAGCPPFHVEPDRPAARAAAAALASVFGREPTLLRSGWSVPAAAAFREVLGVESLLLGFGAPSDNAHAPDESLYLPDFRRGILTMVDLWPRLREVLG